MAGDQPDKPDVLASGPDGQIKLDQRSHTVEAIKTMWPIIDGLQGSVLQQVHGILDLFERAEFIPQQEKDIFLFCLKYLPPEIREKYLISLKAAMHEHNPVDALCKFRGIIFELSRRGLIISQGQEEVGVSHPPLYIEYVGYGSEGDLSQPPNKTVTPNMRNKRGDIESNIDFIWRDGKPYIYDTKRYPRRAWGKDYGKREAQKIRDQILRYQTAVKKKLEGGKEKEGPAAGATIELTGRMDYKFLKWLTGESVFDREGPAPDVEIIYSLPLPSGREYRFALKQCRDQGLKFYNDHGEYSKEDTLVIRGLAASLRDKSLPKIISDALVEEPEAIKDVAEFNAYETRQKETLWTSLKDKALNGAEAKGVPAYGEQVTREYVHEMLCGFEQLLETSPGHQRFRDNYLLPREKWELAVDTVMRHIGAIKEDELARQSSSHESDMRAYRIIGGYTGPRDGYFLNVERIMFDVLGNLKKAEKGGKIREYDDEKKSMTLAEFMPHLAKQDRSFLKIVTYDPTTKKHASRVIEGENKTEECKRVAAESANNIFHINLQRCEAKLDDLVSRFEALKRIAAGRLDEAQRAEFRSLQSSLADYYKNQNHVRIKALRGHLGDLNIKRRNRDISKEQFSAESLVFKQELLDLYKTIFKKSWDSFALREVTHESRNILKVIYIIDEDGEVMVEEERFEKKNSYRAAHTELANKRHKKGRNVYAAGELAFERVDGKWKLIEVNNGSGHYMPDEGSLAYACNVISGKLGLDKEATLRLKKHCIFRGIDLDGFPSIEYR